MISYEIIILLALFPAMLGTSSLSLEVIAQAPSPLLLPSALFFFLALLAETNRSPFDLPEAEAELVAGYNIDYSAFAFAFFFLGEYANMLTMGILFVVIFLGPSFLLPKLALLAFSLI
jgi:NADH-quinone oxidoreductase subunit H